MPKKPPGRPRTADDVRELVLRIARENGWGYTRILGELKKLGLGTISRSTVVNILKEAGLDPCPKRGEQTWAEFIEAHAATLWQCDFFSHTVLTLTGWKTCFMLVFLHVGTRRVFLSPASLNPSGEWMREQATAFVDHLHAGGHKPHSTILFRDRDSKYTEAFDTPIALAGVEVRRAPPRAPNLQAFVERWIQSVKVECLDKFIALGPAHLEHLVREYVEHHHDDRPHQGVGNRTLALAEADEEPPVLAFPERVECDRRLGGVLKSDRRAV